jgi:predicted lipoprotein with Yx(FWY)xxD motif
VTTTHRIQHHVSALGATLAVIGATLGLAVAAGGTSTATLKSNSITNYPHVLANSKSHEFYVLSDEKGAKLHCTGGCLSTWIPLTVSTSTTKVTKGSGVDGTIGFVKRSSTKKQVTFNGYPVYTYVYDSGANQSNGEGQQSNGGTWYLVRATATNASGTPVKSPSGGGTTTTTSGGGGGW